ncbi:MAG: AtpZ/AtpI family protein [Crocinitomicaceae bacterium]|jgi:ATP synthase protein I|nr:AtpZ/AtpI family protein [Crocinitomicaceae bacterium]MDG2464986.1 AtpZ/AtpI family protein [Crocinitomicaceae bacterium]
MSKSSSPMKKYARFSGIVIQMGVIIGLFSWLGTYLDDRYKTENIWAIVLALSGVFLAMYLVIKEVINSSKEDE